MKNYEENFIKKDASALLGIRPSQVQFYSDQGIVIPEVKASAGKGTRRVYSKHNLFQILIVKRLVKHGVSLGEVKAILGGLDNWCRQAKDLAGDPLRNIPSGEKRRFREEGKLAEMLLHAKAVDSIYNDIFLCIHKRNDELRILVFPLEKGQDRSRLDEEIGTGTTSLLVIKISDLIRRVVTA